MADELSIEDRLLKRFGHMVPEGDGWSWDWQADPLAKVAADEIRKLRTEVADLKARVASDPTDVETGEKTPFDQIIDQAMGGKPWTFTRFGQPVAVLLAHKEFERLKECGQVVVRLKRLSEAMGQPLR